MRTLLHRQRDAHRRAHASAALYFYLAAVSFNDGFAQVEADAQAA